jgi:hypothetical protein
MKFVFEKMRNLIIIIVIALTLPLAGNANAQGKSVPGSQISLLISEYKMYDGFEAVKVGRLATGFVKSMINAGAMKEGDPEAKELKKLIKGIKKLAVVDYSDCDLEVRQGFTNKMGRLLSGADVLMEVKDGSDLMRMYGVVDDKGGKVKNFVLFCPEDCTLICLFGTISLDSVMNLASR